MCCFWFGLRFCCGSHPLPPVLFWALQVNVWSFYCLTIFPLSSLIFIMVFMSLNFLLIFYCDFFFCWVLSYMLFAFPIPCILKMWSIFCGSWNDSFLTSAHLWVRWAPSGLAIFRKYSGRRGQDYIQANRKFSLWHSTVWIILLISNLAKPTKIAPEWLTIQSFFVSPTKCCQADYSDSSFNTTFTVSWNFMIYGVLPVTHTPSSDCCKQGLLGFASKEVSFTLS